MAFWAALGNCTAINQLQEGNKRQGTPRVDLTLAFHPYKCCAGSMGTWSRNLSL